MSKKTEAKIACHHLLEENMSDDQKVTRRKR
jgi:hypothetical protein